MLWLRGIVVVALAFIATAYGPPWDATNGSGKTATGIQLAPAPTGQAGPFYVAVDPTVIPLGTKLRACPNPFGDCSIVFQAEDTGGAIKGSRIDFLDMVGRAHQDAFGRRPVQVTVLPGGATPTPAGSAVLQTPIAGAAGPSTSSSPSSSGGIPGPSSPEWQVLLLTGVLLALGVAFLRKGGKRAIGE